MTYQTPPKGEDIEYNVFAHIAHIDDVVTFPPLKVGGETNRGAFLVVVERGPEPEDNRVDIFAANQRTENIEDMARAFEEFAKVLCEEADRIAQEQDNQEEDTDGR